MRLQSITFVSLLSTVLSSPFPEALPTPGDSDISAISGVNITNLGIAGTESVVKNSYIVVYKDNVSDGDYDKYEQEVSKKLGKGLKGTWRVKPDGSGSTGFAGAHVETDRAGLESIAKNPLVSFVELDAISSVAPITGKAVPGESASSLTPRALVSRAATWGLGRISHRARGSLAYVYDNSACTGTRIYILDTGIRITHEQFRGVDTSAANRRAVWGKNFISGSPNSDENGHGTHCAGIAAGYTVGVCRRAKVIAVKVLNKSGKGANSGIIAGIQWAVKDAINKGYRNKAVISLSVGGGYSAALNAAVQSAYASGLTVVVAAGNENANAINYSPSSAPNAITVGATTFYDYRASFSNYGGVLDLFAPGVDIISSYRTSNTAYVYMSGTSQATPFVSGLAAYLISKEKIVGPAKVRSRIVALSTKNRVLQPKGSQNRIAFNAVAP